MSLNINKYFFLTHLIKTYPIIFRFLTSNQITIGAPNTDVTALIGSDISARNLWILSQISMILAQKQKYSKV
jgi:hypothetical protein